MFQIRYGGLQKPRKTILCILIRKNVRQLSKVSSFLVETFEEYLLSQSAELYIKIKFASPG